MFSLSAISSVLTNLILVAIAVIGLVVIRMRTTGRTRLFGTLAMALLGANVVLGTLMTVVAPRLFRARLSWLYSMSSLGLWLLTVAGTVLTVVAICADRGPAAPPGAPGPYAQPGPYPFSPPGPPPRS